MPKRIQRKRSKGWTMPENTVYVGRPTQWGNPYVVKKQKEWFRVFGADGTLRGTYDNVGAARMRATLLFQWETAGKLDVSELRGRNLACWCPVNQPCHCDVLLELANVATGCIPVTADQTN